MSNYALKTKHSVRAKLLSAILVTSSAVTLVLTIIQLANDYHADLDYIEKRMQEIRIGRSATLARALWQLDTTLIETGLEGLLSVQDVIYAEISDQPNSQTQVGSAPYKRGLFNADQAIVFSEPLFHIVDETEVTPTLKAGSKIPLGHLNVVFTKNLIYERLENKAILIMGTQAIKTFVVSFLIMIFIRILITQHLSTMSGYFEMFDVAKPGEPLKLQKKSKPAKSGEDNRDELDLVADAINKMILKVKDAYREQQEYQEQLKELNSSLDRRVKEQTAQLAEEKRQMVLLLDNMSQSVFRVNKDGKIVAPISKHSAHVFSTDIENHNLFELIFNKSQLEPAKKETVEAVFNVTFGEDSLQWEMNEQNLPEKLTMAHSGQVLRMSYSPLYDELDQLTQVLFVIEDITKLEKLEDQRLKSNRQLALLQAFANAKNRDRWIFFNSCEQQILSVENEFARGISIATLLEVYRALHTLKGNARMLKFDDIAHATHGLESQISAYLAKLRSGEPTSHEQGGELLKSLKVLRETATEAANTGVKFFGVALPMAKESLPAQDRVAAVEVLKSNLENLNRTLLRARQVHPVPEILEVEKAALRLVDVDLREGFERLRPMVDEISGRLGKQVDLVLTGHDVSISPRILEATLDAVMHIVRNALDHGLESPDDRARSQKAAAGKLTIAWKALSGSRIQIIVSDDGRGIDPRKVLAKALTLKMINARENVNREAILNLIFLPTFSTATQVSDLSGRGIGLDVVASVMKDLDGHVQLSTEEGQGTNFTLEFTYVENELSRKPQAAPAA